MRLPDFLIIGAMKSGTTSLYNDLRGNPRIFLPEDKEPHCLTDDAVLGEEGRSAYARFFASATSDQVCGEASTGYTKRPDIEGVADRALAVLGPDTKIIYVVRDPVERAISHHYHAFTWGEVHGDADRALRERPDFINYSRYFFQLEPWVRCFGKDNVLVIVFEEYIRDRRGTIERTSRFLGVEPSVETVNPEKVHNKGDRRPVSKGVLRIVGRSIVYRAFIRRFLPMGVRQWIYQRFFPKGPPRPAPPNEGTIAMLREHLDPDAQRLAALLGRSGEIWSRPSARSG